MTRRRELIAVLVVAILVMASIAAIWYLYSGGPTSTTSTAGPIPVGAFLYLWYGNATTGTGGLGSPGWNSTSCPGGGAVVDTPSTGYYVSDSNATFRRQVNDMQNTGINFAVVSWWGPFTSGEAGSINKATLDLFRYLKGTDSSFRVAIMVDAFPGTCSPPLPNLPMSQVYNYIYSNFAAPYKQWYFQWQSKPLLLTFNPIRPLYNDTRFTSREIGNYACKPVNTCPNHTLNQQLDWIWWQAPANFSEGAGGTGVNMTNDVGNPVISSDGEVTIVPRIDSLFNYADGYQSGYLRFDSALKLGLYQFEWNYVLSHRSEVKLVLIYSWNEAHERTEIEPHYELGSDLPQNYLLNLTDAYCAELT